MVESKQYSVARATQESEPNILRDEDIITTYAIFRPTYIELPKKIVTSLADWAATWSADQVVFGSRSLILFEDMGRGVLRCHFG